MPHLRQSTASQEVRLGPFVDSVDGDTPETGLTIANTDIRLFKGGSVTSVDKNSGGATHRESGMYSAVLDATDTDTVGILTVYIKVAGALYAKGEFEVITQVAYDFLYGSSAAPPTAASIADAVWDEAISGHTTTDTFGLSLQPTNAVIASATSSTVTLNSPWNAGSAVGRAIYANGQGRVLVTHTGSGTYTLDSSWTAPSNSTAATVGGVVTTPAAIWSHGGTASSRVVNVNLAQTGLSPRDLTSVADTALTVGDAFVSSIVGAAGRQSVVSTAYAVRTPAGTLVRTFTLDSATAPTTRT
jgi:hypothetical protein